MTPDQHTIQETFIEVGDGHTLYVQEWGNPKGTPVIFLHGGPGNGCHDRNKMQFSAAWHRVIFMDQRGCGRSLPTNSIEHNTTSDLVEDIEKVARHFGLQRFVLYGGSWGSCLALAYGLAHPKRVQAMVVTGIFTASRAEMEYFDRGGFADFFPDVWESLLTDVPKDQQQHPLTYHFRQIHGKDSQAAARSAHAAASMERALLQLDDRFTPEPFSEFDSATVRIESHYLSQGCFLPDRHIFEKAHTLTMPIWIVQGRYDMVCPGKTAYELHKRLPNSELIWTTSGHRNERESWSVCRALLLQIAREEVA